MDQEKARQKALEELEDRIDLLESLQAEREALERGEKPIPWDKAREELDL